MIHCPYSYMNDQTLTSCRDLEYLESLVPEVEKGVDGKRVSTEDEDDEAPSDKP